MNLKALSIALIAFLALSIVFQPLATIAFAPWLLWLILVVWIGWWVPTVIAQTDKPLRDAGRRFALGSVAVTLVSLPLVYLIATLQGSVFGGVGFQFADPQVLLATIVALTPPIYIPLLGLRCTLMYLKENKPEAT